MDDEAYKALLQGLKRCEMNFHSHTREFGKLTERDIAFWAEGLADFTAERIASAFHGHISNESFFPTIKDIRHGTDRNPARMACEDHKYLQKLEEDRRLLPAPERKRIPMPDNMKNLLKKLQSDVKNGTNSYAEFKREINANS
tara:strand:+ start:2294 stop:2722 length:429 start_codon:yes stop_codon:yes gene_type:complete